MEQIYRHARLRKAEELAITATGRSLGAGASTRYLTTKHGDLYGP